MNQWLSAQNLDLSYLGSDLDSATNCVSLSNLLSTELEGLDELVHRED